MTLRGITTLAASTPMLCIIQGSDEFCLDAGGVAGALTLTTPVFTTMTWQPWTSLGTSGNLATQNPTLEFESSGIDSPLNRLSADSAGIVFVDASGAGTLNGGFVDIVRYGRL
jgi:hypothetical protein